MIERQARELMSESRSSGEESASRDNEEDDRDVPMTVLEDDIPLTKTGYSVPPAYPPIQVRNQVCCIISSLVYFSCISPISSPCWPLGSLCPYSGHS